MPMPDILWMLVVWGFILAPVGVIVTAMWWKSRKFRNWSVTEGKIIEARSAFQSNAPHDSNYDSSDTELLNVPHVEFEYRIGQETLCGSRISMVTYDPRYHSAKTILARYPAGKIVPVYFDPGDPTKAALERSFTSSDYFLLFWVILVCLLVPWLVAVFFCQVYARVKPRMVDAGGTAFVTGIIGFGSVFLILTAGTILTVLKSWLWPMTTGRIKSSTVSTFRVSGGDDSSYTSFKPRVLYTYEVDGRKYTGDRVFFSFVLGGMTKGKADRIAGRYQAKDQVKVFYNPRNPAESVLRRTCRGILLFPIIAALILGLAWAMLR